jgi:hypothetical protein
MSGGDLNRLLIMLMKKKNWKEFLMKRTFPDRI